MLDNIVIQDGVSGENFSGEDPVRLVNLAADAKSRKDGIDVLIWSLGRLKLLMKAP